MTIKELKQHMVGVPNYMRVTYLVFGGQGSVYVSILEWNYGKHQLKLKSEPKETFKAAVMLRNLYIFPDDTEILIEGYPGDNEGDEPEWYSPNRIEIDITDKSIDLINEPEDEDNN